MLKELNVIAAGLLGLHGYSTQPLSWSALDGSRQQDGRAKKRVSTPQRDAGGAATNDRADAALVPSANGHVYG